MNIKKLLAVILVLLLAAGCTARDPQPVDEEIGDFIEESLPEQEPEEKLESFTPPEPEEIEEEDEEEPLEESQRELAKPDDTPAKSRPLAQVEKTTDQEAIDALRVPLEELEVLDNTSITWGPGLAGGEQQPSEPLRLQNAYGNLGAYFIVPNSGEVYLSFDEGYELGYTPAILDALKEKDVKAVFFVTLGYVQSRPDLIERIINEGHILGNHSSSHPVGGMPTMDTLDMAKDIIYLHNLVKENYGYEMTLFRPPEGTFSQQSLAVLDALGYKSIFWSFAYNDWNPENQMEPDKALSHILGHTHQGEIMLLHAVSATNTTILKEVIDEVEAKGYSFASWNGI